MASIWDTLYGVVAATKNRLGLQDADLIKGDVSKAATGLSASQVYGVPNSDGGRLYDNSGVPAPKEVTPPPTTTTGGGGNTGSSGGGSGSNGAGQPQNNNGGNNNADQAMRDAANAQAEAIRQAAQGRYNSKVQEAGKAKELAKGRYDWLTDALGTNKKTALEEVMMNEKQGVENYQTQEKTTKESYSTAKQEILGTYRDLKTNQEKILRASGNQSSSRNREAELKLNNLLGKDVSAVSKQEADSLAAIGNAITYVKEQSRISQQKIENESKQKMDEAALNYNSTIAQIDSNINLAGNERADAYAQAEASLAGSIAQIEQWAAQVNTQAQKAQASTADLIDSFIVDMTDANKSLNMTNAEKRAAALAIQEKAAAMTPDQNAQQAVAPQGGIYINTNEDEDEKTKLTTAEQLQKSILGNGLLSSPEAASSAQLKQSFI